MFIFCKLNEHFKNLLIYKNKIKSAQLKMFISELSFFLVLPEHKMLKEVRFNSYCEWVSTWIFW